MAKLLFLQCDGYEAFGPMYLSSALKARGHEADVIVASAEGRSFWDALTASNACFYWMAHHPWFTPLLTRLRQKRIPALGRLALLGGVACALHRAQLPLRGLALAADYLQGWAQAHKKLPLMRDNIL